MAFKTREEMHLHWENEADRLLKGRTIVRCRIMTREETEALCWSTGGIVLHLDNGTIVYSSTDDEGNGPGAFFIDDEEGNHTLPVITPRD